MKRNKGLYLVFLFLLTCGCYSQQVEKLRFKKDASLIYFFQKSKKSDTLHKKEEHLFYLVMPDSLKKSFSMEVENGQMLSTANDSLVKLVYLPGFKYESFYTPKDSTGRKAKSRGYILETAVDGISILPKDKISVSLINKKTGGLILENIFIYTN